MFTTIARRTCVAVAAAATAGVMGLAPAAAQATGSEADGAEPQLLLVLDASRSMEDPSGDGEPKIDAARAALYGLLDSLEDDQRVGFRVFGATSTAGPGEPESCTDSQLVVPIDTGNRSELRDAVEAFAPRAETPMGYALQEAGKDLGTEGPRSIVLVSDGRANCDPDPCEVARDLAADGVDLAIHAVGLNVDSEARQQLQCIANAGNGQYFDASDTESLTAAMDRLSTRAFRPFSVAGTPIVGTESAQGAPELVGGGQYTDAVGGRGEVKHYLLRRELAGSSLHVGVSAVPPLGQRGQIWLEVNSLDSTRCAFVSEATSVGNFASWQMINALLTVWPRSASGDDPCRDDEELVLTVEMTGVGQEGIAGVPFELLVVEEPAVTDQSTLPGRSSTPQWEPMSPAAEDAIELAGGSSFNDAPLLEPGVTYASDVMPGETVYFRVPVDWGQQLQAEAHFPEPGPALSRALRSIVGARITLISPTRGVGTATNLQGAEHTRGSHIRSDQETILQAATTDVRWMNRSARTVEATSLPGEYYVAVAMDQHSSGESFVTPFVLTVDTVGDVAGAPHYREVPFTGDSQDEGNSDETAEGTSPAEPGEDPGTGTPGATEGAQEEEPADETDETAARQDARDDSGVGIPILVGLGVLGLALLGSGAVVLGRLRR